MASPGGKEYGALSVLLGIRANVETLFDIPGEAFYPPPAIKSTLIRIVFDHPPKIYVSDYRLLTRLVKTAFASRRKTLRNNLKSFSTQGLDSNGLQRAATNCGIDLGRRAEALSPEEFAAFSNAIGHETESQ